MEELNEKIVKPDISLLIACLIGGAAGTIGAEMLYRSVTVNWNPIFRVGIYFATIMLCCGLAGIISEFVTNNLRELRWTGSEKWKALLLFILLTIVFGVIAMLFQLIYGLGYSKNTTDHVDDYIILIDHSASTTSSDPNNERYSAVEALVKELDSGHQIMVEVFNDQIVDTFSLRTVDEECLRDLSDFFISVERKSLGGTDIQLALMDSLEQYTDTGRSCAVLLLSDGESEIDYDKVSSAFVERNVPIYSIAFSQMSSMGERVLNNLANDTDGYYYQIDELGNLSDVVKNMIQLTNHRNLLEARRGSDGSNLLPAIERIIFVSILGIITILILGVAVDVYAIVGRGIIIHLPLSIIASLILEFGTQGGISEVSRFLMGMMISVIFVFYTKTDFFSNFMDDTGIIGEDPYIGLEPTERKKTGSKGKHYSADNFTNEFYKGDRK